MDWNKELENYWKINKDKFESIVNDTTYKECGIWFTEGFFVCSIFDILGVDMLLESGTAWGQSTTIFAKYFDFDIITMDQGGYKGADVGASKRLSKYDNVKILIGPGEEYLNSYIKTYDTKTIGIFIDGPKDEYARIVGNKCISNDNVVVVGYHDMFVNVKYKGLHGKLLDTKILEFIGRDYFYLNDKIFEIDPEQNKYKPDGPGVLIQLK